MAAYTQHSVTWETPPDEIFIPKSKPLCSPLQCVRQETYIDSTVSILGVDTCVTNLTCSQAGVRKVLIVPSNATTTKPYHDILANLS